MATFDIQAFSVRDAAGRLTIFDAAEVMRVEASSVRHVGPYIGPDQRAWGTIFIDPPTNSPHEPVTVNTAQAPLTIRQRMLALNAAAGRFTPPAVPVAAPVAASRPVAAAPAAPVLKPRGTLVTSSSGGF